jgi:hypothetical protein
LNELKKKAAANLKARIKYAGRKNLCTSCICQLHIQNIYIYVQTSKIKCHSTSGIMGATVLPFCTFSIAQKKKDPLPRTLFQNTSPRKNYFPSIDYNTIFFSVELTVKRSWLLEKNKTQMGRQNGRSNSFKLDGRRSFSTSTFSSLATYFVSLLNCTPVAD